MTSKIDELKRKSEDLAARLADKRQSDTLESEAQAVQKALDAELAKQNAARAAGQKEFDQLGKQGVELIESGMTDFLDLLRKYKTLRGMMARQTRLRSDFGFKHHLENNPGATVLFLIGRLGHEIQINFSVTKSDFARKWSDKIKSIFE